MNLERLRSTGTRESGLLAILSNWEFSSDLTDSPFIKKPAWGGFFHDWRAWRDSKSGRSRFYDERQKPTYSVEKLENSIRQDFRWN